MSARYPFDRDFELAVLATILGDPVVGARLAGLVTPEKFADAWVGWGCRFAADYLERYCAAPTAAVVRQRSRAAVDSGKLTWEDMDRVSDLLDEVAALELPDSRYVYDQVAEVERTIAVGDALNEASRRFALGDVDGVVDTVMKADTVGRLDADLGDDVARSVRARTLRRQQGDAGCERVPTGIPDLDRELVGGLSAGELGVFLAAPGGGKSSALVQVACTVAALGGVAVYYFLEGGKVVLEDRIDACLADMPISAVVRDPEVAEGRVSAALDAGGTIILKRFAGGATVDDMDLHLKQLRASRSLEPRVLLVDYGDLLGTRSRFESSWERVGQAYVDMIGLSARWRAPVWTASQVRRDAVSKRRIDMDDVAESFRKAHNADAMVAITADADDVEAGNLYLTILKCRWFEAGNQIGPFKRGFSRGSLVLRGAGPVADDPQLGF